MFLVLSGTYLGSELSAEFGRIPPSFLPIGNNRLFQLQAKFAGRPIHLTLPDDFEIPQFDQDLLDASDIKVIRTPTKLSLPGALKLALDQLDAKGSIEILHGDTLVDLSDDRRKPDTVAIKSAQTNYEWGVADPTQPKGERFRSSLQSSAMLHDVLCGYFCFSDAEVLRDCADEASFMGVLNAYDLRVGLSRSEANNWFDFGHLSLYYQSKMNVLVSRSFNSVQADRDWLTKLSTDSNKIRAEAYWYENLPIELQLFVPRYKGRVERDQKAGYQIEYLYVPTLSELHIFGKLPEDVWHHILSCCFDFLEACRNLKPNENSPEASERFAAAFYEDVIQQKTISRFENFLESRGWTRETRLTLNGEETPPLGDALDFCISHVRPSTSADISYWHGDFFFGNLFYDSRASRIMAVDPRGLLGDGAPCPYGDFRYDLAKLAHSVIGGYDYVVAGRADLHKNSELDWSFDIGRDEIAETLEGKFSSFVEQRFDISKDELMAITIGLFLSMLPLHADSQKRQDCFLANALRLYRLVA